MRRKFKGGTTSLNLSVVVYDTTSTTGAGLSGLTHTTSGLILEYRRAGQSTWTQLGVDTGLVSKNLGDYVSGGICANGDRAGRYEIGIPDAAIAAGVRMVEICLRGAANMHPVDIEIELDAVDYQDAAAFGLSRIDQTIGSRSTLTAGGVRTELATELARIDATVSSRATQSSVDAIDDFIDTEVLAIKNKTDLIVAFPDNFGSLDITVGGAIAELGPNALTANGAVDAIPTAVWNALLASYTTANTFGARVVRSLNSNNTVQITGSHHAAAVLHDAEPNSIPEDAFVSGALSARALAADAVGEIADGVWDEPTSGHTTAGTTGKALIDSGAAGNPWAADLATGYSGTQAGNILNSVKSQADLIQSGGTVNVSTPVTATGQLASPLIIGDDYLAANGRRFRWTVELPSGYAIATSTARFGMRYEDDEGVNEFVSTGTVTDATGGNVHLDFDVAKTVTGTLRPGWYQWSVEIVSGSGVKVTRVKSGKNAEWQEKQT
jgi:hypothetical protein